MSATLEQSRTQQRDRRRPPPEGSRGGRRPAASRVLPPHRDRGPARARARGPAGGGARRARPGPGARRRHGQRRGLHPHRRGRRLVQRAHRRPDRHRRHAVPRRLGHRRAASRRRARPPRRPPAARLRRHAAAPGGHLRRLAPADDRRRRVAESWMHLEIDRVGDAERPGRARDAAARRARRRPRRASRTGRRCASQVQRDRRRAASDAAPASTPTRSTRRAALLRWLADDNFTFLGYREYALVAGRRRGRAARRCPDRASASCATTGRRRQLRAGCPPTPAPRLATPSCSSSPRPTRARPCTARPTSTTSASSASTPTATSIGERRFLGLFASAAYTERCATCRSSRAQGRGGAASAPGFRRDSHSGKDLLRSWRTTRATSCSRPTPDDLYDIADRRPAPAGAAQDPAVPAPRQVRPVLSVPGLPAARPLHDPVRLRWRRSCARPSTARASTTRRGSGSRCSPGCTSSCACRRGPISPRSTRTSRERLVDATRTWDEDLAEALRAARREGAARLVGLYSGPSPRPTRRTSRRGRRSPTCAASRRSAAADAAG